MTRPTSPITPPYSPRIQRSARRLPCDANCPIVIGHHSPEACLPAPALFAQLAATYRQHGYPPIPVRPGSKAPCLRQWSRWSKELPPAALVQEWANRYPDAGLAIALGPASGLTALDLDYDVDGMHARVLEAAGPSPVAKR